MRWKPNRPRPRPLLALTALAGAAAAASRLVARGTVTVDTGIGRRLQPLGPLSWQIAASRETVFDVIAAPYLQRTPVALRHKLEVWERGSDTALAAHFTPLGRDGVTTTVEMVRFDPPHQVDFRLLRGPVPHVAESFKLEDEGDKLCTLTWQGELGTDFWAIGAWWGHRVAREWEKAVRQSVARITKEAERRSARQ